MKEFSYTIKDEVGIHARPAGMLVKEAGKFRSSITLECGGKTADAKKLFAVMGLGAKQGSEVKIRIEGSDEDTAIAGIREFFEKNL